MSYEKIQEQLNQLTLIKENLATNLNNLNVPSSKNEPWEDLVSKVDELSLIITSATEVEEGTESIYSDGTLYVVYEE